MSVRFTLLAPRLAALALGWGVAGCVHTPPGTSVEIALARRPELVRLPPTMAEVTRESSRQSGGGAASIQPEKTELVADAYSRGEFCMKTGADAEAIAAFREAVRIDPKFAQAWNNLAALYEKSGQDKLAMDAFKKAKAE